MKKLVLIGTLAASIFLGCPTFAQNIIKDGKYDNHAALVDESKFSVSKIVDSVEVIKRNIRFKVTYESSDGRLDYDYMETGSFGSGIVIKKEGGYAYILTNDHVIHGDAPLEMLRSRGGGSLSDSEIDKSVKIEKVLDESCIQKGPSPYYTLEEVVSDADLDMALVKVKDSDDFKAFPYKLGNSDDLEQLDLVFIVGSPLNIKNYVLEGNVSRLYVETRSLNPWQHQLIKNDRLFMIGCDVQSGYSGGPVIAIRDGEYELVGLVNAVYINSYWDARSGGYVIDPLAGYGIAVKINPIMEKVNAYFDSLKKNAEPEKNLRPSGRGVDI